MKSFVLCNPKNEILLVEADGDLIVITSPIGQQRMTVSAAMSFADYLVKQYGSDVIVFAEVLLKVARESFDNKARKLAKLSNRSAN